jgi:hypothetical protein
MINRFLEVAMRTYRWMLLILIFGVPVAAQAKGKDHREYEFIRTQALVNAAPAAQGVASRLLINPLGEVDGLLLDTGLIVTFPPHMSEQLAAVVKAGDPVTVKGYPETPTQIKGYVITNNRSNQTVMTQPKPPKGTKMPPHLRGAGLKEMSAQGEVRHLRYGKHGEINGLILSDGTIVRFPREASRQFLHLFRVGQSIAASGYGTQNELGRALEATALGPQGQTPQPLYRR